MGGSASVAIGRYLLGVAALVVIGASLALAAVAIRRRILADWTGAPARLAESVIGLALLIGVLELLGTVGLFAFAPIVVASILLALLTRRWASLRSASVGPVKLVRTAPGQLRRATVAPGEL